MPTNYKVKSRGNQNKKKQEKTTIETLTNLRSAGLDEAVNRNESVRKSDMAIVRKPAKYLNLDKAPRNGCRETRSGAALLRIRPEFKAIASLKSGENERESVCNFSESGESRDFADGERRFEETGSHVTRTSNTIVSVRFKVLYH